VTRFTSLYISVVTLLVSVLDATAKWPDGILDGNLVAVGSYDECVQVRADIAGDDLVVAVGDGSGLTMDVFPVDRQFRGKYCRALLDLTG
jgi:hypothetical protein